LGKGMEEDAYGVRRVLAEVPEALIAYSCDKNFGMYRDRVGAIYVLAENAAGAGPRYCRTATRWPAQPGQCRPITAGRPSA
jgi:aspartate/tyrosine/aromatic aminotransferase